MSAQLTLAKAAVDITYTDDSFALVDQFVAISPAVVLIGIRRGKPSGMDALDLLLSLHPSAPVIAFGVAPDSALLALAISRGARGIMLCDVDRPDGSADQLSPAPVGPGWCTREGDPVSLTTRESQVLVGMSAGKSNSEIGRELYLSEDTIKTHARRLFGKLGARDRAHAVALAMRLGQLD